MGYHYDPLLAIFDAWILILLVTLIVMAGIRLRGRRRHFVCGGFGLWALATVLWLPPVLGRLFAWLGPAVGPDLAQQAPLVPWLAGVLLITAGVLLPPGVAVGSTSARPASARPPTGPASKPPTSDRPPAGPGHPVPTEPVRSFPPPSPPSPPRESMEAR